MVNTRRQLFIFAAALLVSCLYALLFYVLTPVASLMLALLSGGLFGLTLLLLLYRRLLHLLRQLAESLRRRETSHLVALQQSTGPLGLAAREAARLIRQRHMLGRRLAAARQVEASLLQQIELLSGINANLPGIIYRVVLEPDGRIVFPPIELSSNLNNPQASNPPHPQSLHWLERIHLEDRAAFFEVLQSSAEQLAPFDLEQRVMVEDGEEAWIRNITRPHRRSDGATVWDGILLDITTQKHSELTLQRSLREKEVLLQEIHHRVKNNLQIISSMLDLQALALDDPRTCTAFVESQKRVQAMALVHQQLYHSSDLAHIDFAAYVQTLVEHLAQFDRAAKVRFDLVVADLQLDGDTAIPFALIINELVTNALKHAFPTERNGTVRIACRVDAQDQIELTVSDDGVGMPATGESSQPATLGLQLVATLARQLRGTVSIQRQGGTTVTISAPRRRRIQATR